MVLGPSDLIVGAQDNAVLAQKPYSNSHGFPFRKPLMNKS
jgi:hypothetical protein